MSDAFRLKLQENSKRIGSLLDDLLFNQFCHSGEYRIEGLISAIRYATLNGGKRLRSFLVVECAALFGFNGPAVLHVGAAIECVHCYSLIHDDLPAMDDGHIRRGKPTVHIEYDEATAILAGNSLLTYAFEIIFSPEIELKDGIRSDLALLLARSAGLDGMLGGQMLDMQEEFLDETSIFTLLGMKTGALMRFSCEAGAIIAGVGNDERIRLRNFGENLGIIFQLADDLLDLDNCQKNLEKISIKNATSKKNSFVRLKGSDWIKKEITRRTVETLKILECYGQKAQSLRELTNFLSY
ncbi:polyprenyl synthetase family protein [Candidatus Liberibacter sp.]|uniref:polyprenyl synthetase family protein n=1 Tax=Candidatus Liberibacter sp. TaxID=34022 RepID=UPI0015F44CBC|nr:polyprenyl synthetase family protein [Candidatus Liberibacter sp.]MBA5723843.1 polyprenyl synthetase family protein [Candidatus Liberibacter sp.]